MSATISPAPIPWWSTREGRRRLVSEMVLNGMRRLGARLAPLEDTFRIDLAYVPQRFRAEFLEIADEYEAEIAALLANEEAR